MFDTITENIQRYSASATGAVRLIERIEREYGFDSSVDTVIALPWPGGWYFPLRPWGVPIANVIKVPAARPRTVELKTFVYHELGHAICDHFEIRSYLVPFVRRFQRTHADYERASLAAAELERSPGFVSGYARCNREEDFCETFAAYLLNRSTWRRSVRYEGETIDVRSDHRLREKLDAVHKLLNEIHTFV